MPAPLHADVLHDTADLIRRYGSINKAAAALGMSRSAIQKRFRRYHRVVTASARPPAGVPVPDPLPPEDISDDEWVAHQKTRFRLRKKHWQARVWRPVNVPVAGPYGLLVLGDPHVDDDGADWDQIDALSALQRRNRGRIWAVNMGDSTNNWAGRLARLWADQSTGAKDARRAARIFMNRFDWLLWLHGNHDVFGGPVGSEWFEAHRPEFCVMEDWSAKLTLVSPDGSSIRAWFSHDFKGHSLWNVMHGLLRASRIDDPADLYVAGHRHTAGMMQFENTAHDTVPVLLRVRGFKYLDEFAHRHQFPEQEHGAAALVVVNPSLPLGFGRVTAFLDPFAGEAYLHQLLAGSKNTA